MGTTINLKEKFKEYLDEVENYGTRYERFLEESHHGPDRMINWLEAAFMAGANVMAMDTLDTLLDYGTAVAGIALPTYNSTDAFDMAHDNLAVYFTEIFEETELNK